MNNTRESVYENYIIQSDFENAIIEGAFEKANTRQCDIKVIKLCQVRTKLIAVGGYRVTVIFGCQTNP